MRKPRLKPDFVNRRRCKMCHDVDTGKYPVDTLKLSGTITDWYCRGCVPKGVTDKEPKRRVIE